MAKTQWNLSPVKEIYCINCHEELILNPTERKGGEIVCPKCKASFCLQEAIDFLRNMSPILEGQCPSCWEDLTFDIEDRINKGKIKCPLCKDLFYMAEVLNSSTQVSEKIKSQKNPEAPSHSKVNDNFWENIQGRLEHDYKMGYLLGYKESLTLFSELFEEMDARNEINSRDFVRDIMYKVIDIQNKKEFSKMYNFDNIHEDISKEQKTFLRKFVVVGNENFEEGYKKGRSILLELYLSFNKKIFITKETLIKEVREKLVELMKPIKDFI